MMGSDMILGLFEIPRLEMWKWWETSSGCSGSPSDPILPISSMYLSHFPSFASLFLGKSGAGLFDMCAAAFGLSARQSKWQETAVGATATVSTTSYQSLCTTATMHQCQRHAEFQPLFLKTTTEELQLPPLVILNWRVTVMVVVLNFQKNHCPHCHKDLLINMKRTNHKFLPRPLKEWV